MGWRLPIGEGVHGMVMTALVVIISFSSGYGLGYVNPFGVCNSHRDCDIPDGDGLVRAGRGVSRFDRAARCKLVDGTRRGGAAGLGNARLIPPLGPLILHFCDTAFFWGAKVM